MQVKRVTEIISWVNEMTKESHVVSQIKGEPKFYSGEEYATLKLWESSLPTQINLL